MQHDVYKKRDHFAEKNKKCFVLHRTDHDKQKFLDAACQGGGQYVDFSKHVKEDGTSACDRLSIYIHMIRELRFGIPEI